MARLVLMMSLVVGLGLPLASAVAGGDNYEPTHPPRIVAAAAEASAFYLEFRARKEAHGFGHAYVTLGTVEAGRIQQTVVVGFMPKSVDDDHWSKFGLPVTGLVGVTRSDFVRPPDVRFRVALSKAAYFRVVNEIRNLPKSWTTYELLVRNCNNFVSQIASSVGLRTPLITAQYPVRYVRELRALNVRPFPA
jgi:hypothetical protein